MTRLDADDTVVTAAGAEEPDAGGGPRAVVLESREVPLGGVRAMSVHRSLPQRDLPLVGAWCFLDRFGPQETRMRVEPHPHIGLQTVTWPFLGEIRHRDSLGSDVVLRRGALNLMTSGAGIAHSEYSVGEAPVPLEALQLWVALPESRRWGPPAFERHEDLPTIALPVVSGPTTVATVVLGELAGVSSPASAYTPLVGAELPIPPGARVRIPLHAEWEYAVIVVQGRSTVGTGIPEPQSAADLAENHMLYLGSGRTSVEVGSDEGALVFLLGGEPFDEEIVMWWNFVGRSHEEIVSARDAWEADDPRFGPVIGHGDERIPAPPMPGVRLTRRRRRM